MTLSPIMSHLRGPRLHNRLLGRIQRHAGISTLFRRSEFQFAGSQLGPSGPALQSVRTPAGPAGSSPLVQAFTVPQPAWVDSSWSAGPLQRTSYGPASSPAEAGWAASEGSWPPAPWPQPALPSQPASLAQPTPVQRALEQPLPQAPMYAPTVQPAADQFVQQVALPTMQPAPAAQQTGTTLQRSYLQPPFTEPARQEPVLPSYPQQPQLPAQPLQPPPPSYVQQAPAGVQRTPTAPFQPLQPAPQPGQFQSPQSAPAVQRATTSPYQAPAPAQLPAQPAPQPAQIQPLAPSPAVQRTATAPYQAPAPPVQLPSQPTPQPAQIQPLLPVPAVQRNSTGAPTTSANAPGDSSNRSQPSQGQPATPAPGVQRTVAVPAQPSSPASLAAATARERTAITFAGPPAGAGRICPKLKKASTNRRPGIVCRPSCAGTRNNELPAFNHKRPS